MEMSCICNDELIITNSNIYGGNADVYCNICEDSITTDIMYHCMKYKVCEHPQGYDLCQRCYDDNHQYINKVNKLKEVSKKTELRCNGSMSSNCSYLLRFKTIMNIYHDFAIASSQNHKQQNIVLFNEYLSIVLDDFYHLLYQHHESFEIIFNSLNVCNINKCAIFDRNYRDRNKNDNKCKMYQNIHADDIVCIQLLDKLHCHYSHCIDTGHRFTSKYSYYKEVINDDIINEQKEDIKNDDDFTNILRNDKFSEMNQILFNKRSKLKHDTSVKLQNRSNSKYIHDDNELKIINNIDNYHYGYLFKYGYNGEKCPRFKSLHKQIAVKQKYNSLKTELVENEIASINMHQFNYEYRKSAVLFNSYHCKKTFNQQTFKKEYILALMFYCNFDNLSYQFSKTYREENGAKHTNYYFMGKLIKIAVHEFGSQYVGSTMFHGISSKMMFDRNSRYDNVYRISSFGPLSMSSQYEIAVNFASSEHGLILAAKVSRNLLSFSCAWISDYSNEAEYLFVQNMMPEFAFMTIENVVDTQSGIQYRHVFTALRMIYIIFKNKTYDKSMKSVVLQKAITKILQNRLSKNTCIEAYASQLIEPYFDGMTSIQMSYYALRDCSYSFLFQVLSKTEFGLIEIEQILILFPNCDFLILKDIKLNAKFMDYIYHHITKQFKCVRIETISSPELSAKEAMLRYKQKFEQKLFSLKHNDKPQYCRMLEIKRK